MGNFFIGAFLGATCLQICIHLALSIFQWFTFLVLQWDYQILTHGVGWCNLSSLSIQAPRLLHIRDYLNNHIMKRTYQVLHQSSVPLSLFIVSVYRFDSYFGPCIVSTTFSFFHRFWKLRNVCLCSLFSWCFFYVPYFPYVFCFSRKCQVIEHVFLLFFSFFIFFMFPIFLIFLMFIHLFLNMFFVFFHMFLIFGVFFFPYYPYVFCCFMKCLCFSLFSCFQVFWNVFFVSFYSLFSLCFFVLSRNFQLIEYVFLIFLISWFSWFFFPMFLFLVEYVLCVVIFLYFPYVFRFLTFPEMIRFFKSVIYKRFL